MSSVGLHSSGCFAMVGAVGARGVRFGAFRAVGVVRGLWAVAKVKTSVRAPRLPRFILLVNFNDTLLVVSILDSL